MPSSKSFSCVLKLWISSIWMDGYTFAAAFRTHSGTTSLSERASAYLPALHNSSIAYLAFPPSVCASSAVRLSVSSGIAVGLNASFALSFRMS